jgi:hypothetical protein
MNLIIYYILVKVLVDFVFSTINNFLFYFWLQEKGGQIDWSKILTETYEQTEAGIKTNYYGAKELTQALIPFSNFQPHPKLSMFQLPWEC